MFLFLSAALELFFILPSEIYAGVGKLTQTLVHSPARFPAGILPGSLSFLVGRHSVTVLLQSLLAGIHLVIMLLLSPVSPFIRSQYFLGSLFMGIHSI